MLNVMDADAYIHTDTTVDLDGAVILVDQSFTLMPPYHLIIYCLYKKEYQLPVQTANKIHIIAK